MSVIAFEIVSKLRLSNRLSIWFEKVRKHKKIILVLTYKIIPFLKKLALIPCIAIYIQQRRKWDCENKKKRRETLLAPPVRFYFRYADAAGAADAAWRGAATRLGRGGVYKRGNFLFRSKRRYRQCRSLGIYAAFYFLISPTTTLPRTGRETRGNDSAIRLPGGGRVGRVCPSAITASTWKAQRELFRKAWVPPRPKVLLEKFGESGARLLIPRRRYEVERFRDWERERVISLRSRIVVSRLCAVDRRFFARPDARDPDEFAVFAVVGNYMPSAAAARRYYDCSGM